MIAVGEPDWRDAVPFTFHFPSAPQFTPYTLTAQMRKQTPSGLPQRPRLRLMHLHFASDTLTFHSSLPQICLLPGMKPLHDHPYHLLTSNLSQGASPTRRVAKCRAPQDHLSPWPLRAVQPSATVVSYDGTTVSPSDGWGWNNTSK